MQNFTNLAFGGSLIGLDWAWGNTSTPGLWDFNGCVGGCIPNKTGVIGEPYCGGATGLMPGWQVGVQWVVDQIKDRPHIAGLSLGDEPEIQGVPYAQMCELSEFLKKTLIAAGRKDVFIHYNDGPASGNLKGNGMCKGLDYFSIDSCTRSSSLVIFFRSLRISRCSDRDDPAAEVAASKTAYAPLIPQLRPPNDYEPNGQGLWVVPGIFCEWPVRTATSPDPNAFFSLTPWRLPLRRDDGQLQGPRRHLPRHEPCGLQVLPGRLEPGRWHLWGAAVVRERHALRHQPALAAGQASGARSPSPPRPTLARWLPSRRMTGRARRAGVLGVGEDRARDPRHQPVALGRPHQHAAERLRARRRVLRAAGQAVDAVDRRQRERGAPAGAARRRTPGRRLSNQM